MKSDTFTSGNNFGLYFDAKLWKALGLLGRYSGRGSISGRVKLVCLLHGVQTGSGAHPTSKPMALLPGREADH
jgi:hypothetical protein